MTALARAMPEERRKLLVVGLLVAALVGILAADLARPPREQWSARVLLGAITSYQSFISPALGGAGVRCRFEPSCSRYAEAAIRKHGALVGSWRATWRVLRCGPWTAAGTVDPP